MSLKVTDRRCDLGERNSYCQTMPGLSLLYSHLSSASHSPNPTNSQARELVDAIHVYSASRSEV